MSRAFLALALLLGSPLARAEAPPAAEPPRATAPGTGAEAQSAAEPPPSPQAAPGLRVDLPLTAALTGGALALVGGTELAKSKLAPGSCRWCEPPGFDRAARWRWGDPAAASTASDVLVVALPASLALSDYFLAGRDLRKAGEDALVAAEAVAFSLLATQVAKFSFGRRRPRAWAAGARTSADDDLSFFSGHASASFAAASAFGTVARLRGYRWWPWVYAAGLSGAALVSFLRMGGDKHWLSDALAGAAVGSGIGFATPLLLHRGRDDAPVRVTMTPFPLGVAGVF